MSLFVLYKDADSNAWVAWAVLENFMNAVNKV